MSKLCTEVTPKVLDQSTSSPRSRLKRAKRAPTPQPRSKNRRPGLEAMMELMQSSTLTSPNDSGIAA
eukprot:Skav224149  [mRNA]  locus=scaffold462:410595:411737:+ [translate_table: standard]